MVYAPILTNAALSSFPGCSPRKCAARLPPITAMTGAFVRASKCRAIPLAKVNTSTSIILCRIVQQLRVSIYSELAPLANRWAEQLDQSRGRYPEALPEFLERCHRSGQKRPTPLLLKYGAGDFNCLHRHLYSEIHFPFQLTIFLSQQGRAFTGGEFVLAEQQPRRQSRVEVLMPDQGDAVIFTVYDRPVCGTRGYYRANLRHGVSTVH